MESKKFYWLKLKRDFFKRHDMCVLECVPNGKEIVLLYLKMLVESIDHEGCLRFNEHIPYTAEMLSSVFRTDLEVMKSAIEIMTDLDLLKIESDGTFRLTKFEDFVGFETEAALQKRVQRNLPTLKNGSKRLNGSSVITPNGKTHKVDEKRYGGHGMQALDRASGKCELCGTDKDILIHHNNGYSNELDDLVCLCTSCHGKAHNNKNNGHIKIERPPYVHQMSTDCPPDVCQKSVQSIENRDKRLEKRDKSICTHPTLEEVQAYCQERNNHVDPERWFNYYSANGWKVGRNPMKDWKAAVRTWERDSKPVKKEESFADLLERWEGEDG